MQQLGGHVGKAAGQRLRRKLIQTLQAGHHFLQPSYQLLTAAGN